MGTGGSVYPLPLLPVEYLQNFGDDSRVKISAWSIDYFETNS